MFALNGLMVALVLWLAATNGPTRGAWRAVLPFALVAGLGLSNHMTCALVAPVGVLGVVRGLRETTHARLPVVAAALGAFVVGLLPYAYLLLAPDNDLSWRHLDGLGALWRHALRADYGGPGNLSATNDRVSPLTSIGALGDTLARGWLWVPLAIGLGTLGVAGARPRWLTHAAIAPASRETRVGWITLAAAFALAGPILMIYLLALRRSAVTVDRPALSSTADTAAHQSRSPSGSMRSQRVRRGSIKARSLRSLPALTWMLLVVRAGSRGRAITRAGVGNSLAGRRARHAQHLALAAAEFGDDHGVGRISLRYELRADRARRAARRDLRDVADDIIPWYR